MSEDFTNRPQDAAPSSPQGPAPGPQGADPQGSGHHGPQGSGAGAQRRLERTHEGRLVAGVCSGAGAYLGIDPNLIRIGLAILSLFGGTGIAAYAIGWVLIPEQGKPTSIAQDLFKDLFNKTKK
jgi:phage shock protein PspC (stress-responsive transcriptional regulator)